MTPIFLTYSKNLLNSSMDCGFVVLKYSIIIERKIPSFLVWRSSVCGRNTPSDAADVADALGC